MSAALLILNKLNLLVVTSVRALVEDAIRVAFMSPARRNAHALSSAAILANLLIVLKTALPALSHVSVPALMAHVDADAKTIAYGVLNHVSGNVLTSLVTSHVGNSATDLAATSHVQRNKGVGILAWVFAVSLVLQSADNVTLMLRNFKSFWEMRMSQMLVSSS